MGRSGVKAVPSPRSFMPFWSSDDKIDTTRGKRRRELPQNRQETSSGASAAADGGSPFRCRVVAIRHKPPCIEPHFNHPKERERERETTEHSPTRAQPGSQEAPPPAGGEGGVSKSKCKAKLVAVVGAVCNCGAVAMRCCRGGGRGTWPRTGEVRIAVAW